MKTIHRLCLMGCLLVVFAGCPSSRQGNIQTVNSYPSVQTLEDDLAAARSHRVDIFAPESFEKAEASYANAKMNENEPLDIITQYVEEGRSHLETARHAAGIIAPILDNTAKTRQKAIDAGAKTLGKAFESAENHYAKLTKAVHHQSISYIQKHGPQVAQAFHDLEVTIIQNKALAKVRGLMNKARHIGAPKIAPEAYTIAEKTVKSTEKWISLNPYDPQNILEKTEKAAFQARRLIAVTESAQAFHDMGPEESALHLETILRDIGQSLQAKDDRDNPVKNQVRHLIEAAESLDRSKETLSSEKETCLSQVADLEKKLKRVITRQEIFINRRIAQWESRTNLQKMQRVFSPDEAEIIKRGDQILIRLRDITFPEGEATLRPEHFGLLDKVQNVIQGFHKAQVTIEGYADSTETNEMNQLISQMRAVAVKAYLLGKQTLPPDRIQAVGNIRAAVLPGETLDDGQGIDVVIRPLVSDDE